MRPHSHWTRAWLLAVALTLHGYPAHAQNPPKVVDIPTRPGVTQRFLFIAPDAPKAAAILYAGGHGGLQLEPSGQFGWGQATFVRTRQMFVNDGIAVAVIDAPSDRQSAPYLNGFRLSKEHADDARAVIAWLKEQLHVPVWLVGTSRGTVRRRHCGCAGRRWRPDGLVLTSTILREERGGTAVTDMNLASLTIPVLIVHHQNDGCRHCPVSETDTLLKKLEQSPKAELMIVSGGTSRAIRAKPLPITASMAWRAVWSTRSPRGCWHAERACRVAKSRLLLAILRRSSACKHCRPTFRVRVAHH